MAYVPHPLFLQRCFHRSRSPFHFRVNNNGLSSCQAACGPGACLPCCLHAIHVKVNDDYLVTQSNALLLQGDRYDSQRAVIGSALQDKIQQMQVVCLLH